MDRGTQVVLYLKMGWEEDTVFILKMKLLNKSSATYKNGVGDGDTVFHLKMGWRGGYRA